MGHVHDDESPRWVNLLAISERVEVMPNRTGLSLVGCVGLPEAKANRPLIASESLVGSVAELQ